MTMFVEQAALANTFPNNPLRVIQQPVVSHSSSSIPYHSNAKILLPTGCTQVSIVVSHPGTNLVPVMFNLSGKS